VDRIAVEANLTLKILKERVERDRVTEKERETRDERESAVWRGLEEAGECERRDEAASNMGKNSVAGLSGKGEEAMQLAAVKQQYIEHMDSLRAEVMVSCTQSGKSLQSISDPIALAL
jgi:hypothetical protein